MSVVLKALAAPEPDGPPPMTLSILPDGSLMFCAAGPEGAFPATLRMKDANGVWRTIAVKPRIITAFK